ncbi:hypothetical protein AJ80_06301 [Polytolypa hystricis UAMH7299]|uniref:BZIP domain-containing protein n=1 Tax=Polytolypa hystricis (strain UAMH7299) TaxID=1447883 RepID=A0A2B7XXC2_POLH7|nr:hypothetical protein AJ80_06301 [Polytolypa hystricis UAMH7299]
MDYPYFPHVNPQQYQQIYGPGNPHSTQTPQSDQFQPIPSTEPYDSTFQPFDPPFNFDSSTLIGAPASPPESFSKHVADPQPNDGTAANAHALATANFDDQNPSDEFNGDPNNPGQGRSSSEEKDNLTPAQSRRKAQNRAAQRAFRERKERRVRDLEQELNEYKHNFSSLMEDNESLKRQIAKFETENEILRATSHSGPPNGHHSPAAEPTMTGPMKYSPMDFAEGKEPAHRITVNEKTGERYLNASATWDLIVSHLSNEGLKLDVQDIYERLKGHAQCDGQGPVLEESQVRKAIEDSIRGGSDELI